MLLESCVYISQPDFDLCLCWIVGCCCSALWVILHSLPELFFKRGDKSHVYWWPFTVISIHSREYPHVNHPFVWSSQQCVVFFAFSPILCFSAVFITSIGCCFLIMCTHLVKIIRLREREGKEKGRRFIFSRYVLALTAAVSVKLWWSALNFNMSAHWVFWKYIEPFSWRIRTKRRSMIFAMCCVLCRWIKFCHTIVQIMLKKVFFNAVLLFSSHFTVFSCGIRYKLFKASVACWTRRMKNADEMI